MVGRDKPETGTIQQRMSLQDALLGKTGERPNGRRKTIPK